VVPLHLAVADQPDLAWRSQSIHRGPCRAKRASSRRHRSTRTTARATATTTGRRRRLNTPASRASRCEWILRRRERFPAVSDSPVPRLVDRVIEEIINRWRPAVSQNERTAWDCVDRLVDCPGNSFFAVCYRDVRDRLSTRRAFATRATLTSGSMLVWHLRRSRKPSGAYGQHLQPIR
jgi:hypothetical protein